MKLLLDPTTKVIHAWGIPPWSNEAEYPADVVADYSGTIPFMASPGQYKLVGTDVLPSTDYIDYKAVALTDIISTAQTAVGVSLTALTAAQVRSLLACMLYQAGGVDVKTMKVKPLGEWLR